MCMVISMFMLCMCFYAFGVYVHVCDLE
jgi:hypothetical protein